MTTETLMIIGSGALARSVCCGLATVGGPGLRLVVVGRDRARTDETAYLARAVAAAAGRPVTVEPWYAPDSGVEQFAEAVAHHRPAGVAVCASLQSPWERNAAPSAWTSLLAEGGFGLSLPLQSALALRAARALRTTGSDAWMVNGCFPDAVNPLLAALGLTPLCGIGNISTIAESLRASFGPDERDSVRVLAHHLHLGTVAEELEAVAFLEDERLSDVTERLAGQRTCARTRLSHVAGAAAGRLLHALVTGAEIRAHVPGPLGLAGGYPVLVRHGAVRLDLPAGVSQEQAAQWNALWAVHDGVSVDGEQVRFPEQAASALGSRLANRAEGFPVTAIDEVIGEFGDLREKLRRDAAPSGGSAAVAGVTGRHS